MSPYRENAKPSDWEEFERALRRISRAFERFGCRMEEIAERLVIRSAIDHQGVSSDKMDQKA